VIGEALGERDGREEEGDTLGARDGSEVDGDREGRDVLGE